MQRLMRAAFFQQLIVSKQKHLPEKDAKIQLSVITAGIKVKLHRNTLKGSVRCSWKEFEKYTWKKRELNQSLLNFFNGL